jgi:hypothetical protein
MGGWVSMQMDQQSLIHELRSKINQLPVASVTTDSVADAEWIKYRNKLRQNILNDDPRDFCNWETIRSTMFYEPDVVELQFLQGLENWDQWKTAIRESKAGNPRPYYSFNESSGNLIHHAYHLAQLIHFTKCSVQNIPQVVEFGGGYGSMCRMFYQLGFKGRYIIYDLPEFSALQEYFLKSIGIQSAIKKEATNDKNCVVLLSDLNELSKQLKDQVDRYIFVATWSISETSLDFRNRIFNFVSNASYYLIAYLYQFGEVNNHDYFLNFKNIKNDYMWKHFEIDHIKDNWYLIGTNLEK